MSQTKRKRRRKHRGTQAGTIESRGRTGRPPTRSEARQSARERATHRHDTPPTWRSSFTRAVISALVFGVAVVLLFGSSIAQAAPLAFAMVLVYLPMSYYTDRLLYNRRQRRKGTAAR